LGVQNLKNVKQWNGFMRKKNLKTFGNEIEKKNTPGGDWRSEK
jgi:hypothetical protein